MSGIQIGLKSAYIGFIRGFKVLAQVCGLISLLDRYLHIRFVHWFRSLFAIYDIDQLIVLDVPWWTYGAIEQVERFLEKTPDARVFEYGSGASSVWLAKRADSLISIEHDPSWYPIVAEKLKNFENAELKLTQADSEVSSRQIYLSQKEGQRGISLENYASAIESETGPFDLIVIDGRVRTACLQHAQKHLASNGLIVFDNSRRARYDSAIQSSGMKITAFSGLTPSLPYPDKTTLLKLAPADAT